MHESILISELGSQIGDDQIELVGHFVGILLAEHERRLHLQNILVRPVGAEENTARKHRLLHLIKEEEEKVVVVIRE